MAQPGTPSLAWDELSDEAQNGFLLKAATQLDLARIFKAEGA